MSKTQQFKEEYQQLKGRIEDRIKELENKAISSQPRPNHPLSPMHSQSSCSPHCQAGSPRVANPIFCQSPSHLANNSSLQTLHDDHNSNQKQLSQILRENIKVQREMSVSLQVLSEKVIDLTMRQTESQIMADTRAVPHCLHGSSVNDIVYSRKRSPSKRVRSLLPAEACRQKRGSKAKSIINQPKSVKRAVEDAKSENQPQHEYFSSSNQVQLQCPVHERDQIEELYEKRLIRRETYRDSEHRTRKPQRDHLMKNYSAQEKSRKEILAKMARNFFLTYGTR